jgi:short-subunit dehydrogenase
MILSCGEGRQRMADILIIGASRGLGLALSIGLTNTGDSLWLVSRTRPESMDRQDGIIRRWVEADLNTPQEAASAIVTALAGQAIDVLIYNAGIWETGSFGGGYRFETISAQMNIDVITVNLTAAVVCIQALLPNVKQAANAKIILIGSTSGLENTNCPEVAYTASKFGLRGVAHALRESLRSDGVAVTCINPGTFSYVPFEEGPDAVIATTGNAVMPVHDLIAVIRCVMSLSKAACIKEIDMPSFADLTA